MVIQIFVLRCASASEIRFAAYPTAIRAWWLEILRARQGREREREQLLVAYNAERGMGWVVERAIIVISLTWPISKDGFQSMGSFWIVDSYG